MENAHGTRGRGDRGTAGIAILAIAVVVLAAALAWLWQPLAGLALLGLAVIGLSALLARRASAEAQRTEAFADQRQQLAQDRERLRDEKDRFEEALQAVDEERRKALVHAERERAEARRAHDEFMATVSHELRNPLNAIVGWAHVLAGRPARTSEDTEAITAILRGAETQTRAIEGLVDMSRAMSEAWFRTATAPGTAAPGGYPEAEHSGLDGVRVLVVEDDPDSRTMMKRLLRGQGAEVATASSAEEGLERLLKFHPDVLVSDIGMAGDDGYDLIRRVRALRPDQGGRTPALALTAYARADDERRALGAGYEYHLAKPLVANRLLETVSNLADRAQR